MGDSVYAWDQTAADNASSDDEITWAEGQLPGTVNNSARAMMRRVAQLLADMKGTIVTAGSVNAFTIATASTPDSIAQGFFGVIEFDRAPTGASTLNIDAKGAKALRGLDGGAIVANAIDAGDQHLVMYDSGSDHYRLLTWDSRLLNDHAIGATVQGYSTVLANTTASFLTAQETKLSYITVTQAVDLDALETRVNALDQAVVLKGTWDPSGGVFPGSGTAQAGESWISSGTGTIDGADFNVGDRIIATTDNASTGTFAANWFKSDNTDYDASDTVKGIVELATDAETITGTSTTLVVTPAALTAKLGALVESEADFEAGVATQESTISAAKLAAAIAALENKTFVISGTIAGSVTPIVVDLTAEFAYTIDSISHKCATGTFTMDVEIEGVDVTGLAAINVTTTEAEATASAANAVAVGNTVQFVFTGKADTEHLYFTMVCTRT